MLVRNGLVHRSGLNIINAPVALKIVVARRGAEAQVVPCSSSTANAFFRRQPKGLVSVFAHFGVARRSHAMLHHPITPRALDCTKTAAGGDMNTVETASKVIG